MQLIKNNVCGINYMHRCKTYAYYKDICIKGDVRQRTNESLIIEDYEYTLKIQHGGGGGGLYNSSDEL